jgi:signal transduction histidine kinase
LAKALGDVYANDMSVSVTILRTALTAGDSPSLDEAPRLYGAEVVRVEPSSARGYVTAAAARGAVVVVVATDAEATAVLAMGADEVLRAGEVTRGSLALAVERARARSEAREARDRRCAVFEREGDTAFSLLGSAFGDQIMHPLSVAHSDCELLDAALRNILEMSDELMAWTALVTPEEQLRRIAARRLTSPDSDELQDAIDRLRGSIRQIERLADTLRSLSKVSTAEEPSSAGRIVRGAIDLLRPKVAPWIDIEVLAEGSRARPAAGAFFVAALTGLVANTIGALRASADGLGRIEVRLAEREDVLVLEIADEVGEMSPDLRAGLFGRAPERPSGRQVGLRSIRDSVRQIGGDLVVDSEPQGTVVRLFWPMASEEAPVPVEISAALHGDPRRAS